MPSFLLSPRQRECLALAQLGLTAIQIADRLGISEHTVNGYLSSAYRRLGVRNRIQALIRAVQLGEIEPLASENLARPHRAGAATFQACA